MGYMGLGMRKDVYSRKPRKPSKALRKLFEAEIKNKLNSPQNKHSNLSKAEDKEVKLKIRKNIIDRMLLILTCIIVFLIFWYFIK